MAAMAQEAAQNGVEWRVTVPEGASVAVESDGAGAAWPWLVSCVALLRDEFLSCAKRVWRIGADDPRKAVHGLKVGLALTLVSLFYYTRPLYVGVGGNAMWAIMTVVVVFEYTVGGSLYKGFNRAAATASAGALGLGVHWVASNAGDTLEPVILSASVFLLAASATFSRFIPAIKARFDYGVTIFILTYSLVAVSGYRVDTLVELAKQRVSTVAIGIAICLAVCVLICPVWAGRELHLLTVRNMEKLADSLEGCVEDYFAEVSDAAPAAGEQGKASPKAQGYQCVLNAKASEDSQANLARWEPAHGMFGFRHPYSQYQKVGAAMRYCAYCVEALNGCINSEIQAPEHVKKHLGDVCTRVSKQCAGVLREASSSVDTMTTSRRLDFAVAEMNTAVQELQSDLSSLPAKLAEEAAEKKRSPLSEALPVLAAASLLIEVSARVEGVVDAVDALAALAGFKPVDGEKVYPLSDPEDQTMKAVESA